MNKTNKFYWIYLIFFFLILALPLLSYPPLFHPAGWAKSSVFKIIFSVLIFIFIYQILFHRNTLRIEKIKRSLKSSICLWLLVAFLGIYSLATIFSLDLHHSLWGSPMRGGGFLTFAFCIIFVILLLLMLEKKDWQKILDFTIFIGALVALLAIFQKFALFSSILNPYTYRTFSTMGNPMALALYLLLLTFLAFSFGIKAIQTRKKIKALFYFSCFILYITAIIFSATRAALLGLIIGFLFFFFLYPGKKENHKKLIILKILLALILISGLLGAYWLNTKPQLVEKIEQNNILGTPFHRIWSSAEPLLNIKEISFSKIVTKGRYSGWQVAFQALKDRPILGYGPENFSIAFDKYYDSTLPKISSGTSWWDKGHNFMLDISISAGIPALIIYILLFAALFWQLRKIKRKNPNDALICHGIQATFIGYLSANFFSFDVFDTYLISFLLIAYSLFLIRKNNPVPENIETKQYSEQKTSFWKYLLMLVLSCTLIWFIWPCNIKPLQINKEINWAGYYYRNNQCGKALQKMEEILPIQSIIDNHVRLEYINVISECIKQNPETNLNLSIKAVSLLEECAKLRPYYTRTWLYLGVFTNRIINLNTNLTLEEKEQLAEKAYSSLERAQELSPKRPEIFMSLVKTDLLMGKYERAEERAEKCIELDPTLKDCWWAKALALISFGEEKSEEAIYCIKKAIQGGTYTKKAKNALSQLIKIYVKLAKDSGELRYYEILADLYQELIKLDFEDFQNHASLAYAYKELGEYDKAREEAMIVLELSPESRPNVEEFLKSLPGIDF